MKSDWIDIISKIELWDKKLFKGIYSQAEKDPDLMDFISNRYRQLMDFSGIANLKNLWNLPEKIAAKKLRKIDFQPDDTSIVILATLPVEKISFEKTKMFPAWIGYLKRLQELLFFDCLFKQVPAIITCFPNLKQLYIFKSKITRLPDAVCDLPLEELTVSSSLLDCLPENIGNLKNLTRLDISDSQLTELPASVTKLSELTFVRLSGSRLASLPEGFGNLENVSSLDLNGNLFSELPPEIKSLSGLRVLVFGGNPIAVLPEWIEGFSHLNTLEINQTKIAKLPACITKLTSLCSLNISGSPVQEGWAFKSESVRILVAQFLRQYFNQETDNPVARLFADLESRDKARMDDALKRIQADAQLQEAAEKRYLAFIRTRLNNDTAGLGELYKVQLTEEEEAILVGKTLIKNYINLSYLYDVQSRLVVDVLGSIVKSHISMDEFCAGARKQIDQNRLMTYSSTHKDKVQFAIRKTAAVYSSGWWGKILLTCAGMELFKIRLDHTAFELANDSPVLREFVFFTDCFANGSNARFDIFQSDVPNFTEVFWLLNFVPDTIWGDMEPVFPPFDLKYERKAHIKTGDMKDWQTISTNDLR
jgi:hypothetical protein